MSSSATFGLSELPLEVSLTESAEPLPFLGSPTSAPNPTPAVDKDNIPVTTVKEFPKSAPRPSSSKGKRKGRAGTMTDNSVEQVEIREKHRKRMCKLARKGIRGRPRKVSTEVRPQANESSEEEGQNVNVSFQDSSEYSEEEPEQQGNFEQPSPFQEKVPEVGDYVLMDLELEGGRFAGERVHYVGKVVGIESDVLTINYLRLSAKFGNLERPTFYFPDEEDKREEHKDSVVGVLKTPVAGATKRLKKIVKFDVPLLGYSLR